MKDSLSDTNPLIPKKEKKKKNANPYKNTKPLINTKKKKKIANPKTQTVFPDQNLDSNLRFFVTRPYTHRSD